MCVWHICITSYPLQEMRTIDITVGLHIHCLSNAMRGQNINLPECVCLSLTLSVNSPTGQTPQRIFTVDSLKDADLRKDVPLGVF